MLAKLCLRQEGMLNAMCLDRNFLLFIQAGKGSILPPMLTASREWHTQKQQAGVTCPLRQIYFPEGGGRASSELWPPQYRR